jgi:hypothetical protein
MCPHNSAFFAAPNAQAVLQQQYLEMQQKAGIVTTTPTVTEEAAQTPAAEDPVVSGED